MPYTGTQLGSRQGEPTGTLAGTKQMLDLRGGRNGDWRSSNVTTAHPLLCMTECHY